MGNTIARDFKDVQLGEGSLPSSTKGMIAQRSLVLKKPMTVLVKRDHHRKNTIVFDLETMLPIYITSSKKRNGLETSITKDRLGNALFLITSSPNQRNKNTKLIYKAPQNICAASSSTKSSILETIALSPTPAEPDFSNTSTSPPNNTVPSVSSASHYEHNHHHHHHSSDDDVPCTAQIDIDRSGAAVCAFLSVYVWKGTGPELMSVYKAVRIPDVKYGVLVVDAMDRAEVVGKSYLDEKRMQPIVEVAAGTDLPSVLALALTLLGDRIV